MIEVEKAGHIMFRQGDLNVPGDGFDDLNGPYDAKQIGDFTGLTPPFDPDGRLTLGRPNEAPSHGGASS